MPAVVVSRLVLVTLAVISLVLLALIIAPFAAALLFAAVLASALSPWSARVAAALGDRRRLTCALFTFAVLLLIILPLSVVIFIAAREIVDGVAWVISTLQSEGVAGILDKLPGPLQSLARRAIGELPDGPERIQRFAAQQAGRAASLFGGLLEATSGALVQVAMMLIAFYFLLLDGAKLVDWICAAAPLEENRLRAMLADFRSVSVAVLSSSVLTALIQTIIALAGYLMFGVPQPFFFALITFVIAFIPAVGAGSVVVATAVLQLLADEPWHALFLAIWGIVVVGLSDNLLKPWLMKGRIEVHGAVIFFALLGGLATFGAVGLLAGPLIVAFFMSVTRLSRAGPELARLDVPDTP